MSLFEGGKYATWLAVIANRARRDLQFSNIFYVDLFASAAYAVATVYLLRRNDSSIVCANSFMSVAVVYVLLHLLKIFLIIDLERRGGDARQFVSSDKLVTTGLYAWTRNPVYVISIAQSLFWSILLLCLSNDQKSSYAGYALAALLLYAHYWGIDRLIIPHEEAALRRKHPREFAAYAARVRRWVGRKA